MEDDRNLVVLGADHQCGSYVLHFEIPSDRNVLVGGGQRRRPVRFPAGHAVYIGSAMGGRTSNVGLGRRLVRHATRTGGRAVHGIYTALLASLKVHDIGPEDPRLRAHKKLHWEVDYVLDEPDVELRTMYALRSNRPLESALASLLARSPDIQIIEKGMGARDVPGSTHLVMVPGKTGWWQAFESGMRRLARVDTHTP